jgi:hypothetical protein
MTGGKKQEIASLLKRLRAVVAANPALEIEEADGSTLHDAERSRLEAAGYLRRVGPRVELSNYGPRWTLPESYDAFVELNISLEVRYRGSVLWKVLSPSGAAWMTQDLSEALNDHREDEWGSECEADYGIDRCVVFATGPGWMNGWAFDTRVREHGECAIRPIIDFSADEGAAMSEVWLADDMITNDDALSFFAWLDAQIDDLDSLPADDANEVECEALDEDFDPNGLRFFVAGELASMSAYDAKHAIYDIGGEPAKSLGRADVVVVSDRDDEARRAALSAARARMEHVGNMRLISEADFVRLVESHRLLR